MTSPATNRTLTCLHHATLTVDDLLAARVFYGELLGLSELHRPTFPVPGAWFEIGDQQLHLAEYADHSPHQRSHVAFGVGDLDSVATHLQAAGVSARILAGTAGVGRQMNLRDPSGNLIELYELSDE